VPARVVHVLFHGIGRPGRELEPGEDAYWIPESTFLGVLDEVVGRPEVRLSFDDGNASDVEIALPALAARGLVATFFVLAGRLDQRGSLTPGAVGDLVAAGMAIGNHGMDHRSWRGMDAAAVRRELVEARDRLRDVVGAPVDRAAAPFGLYDRRALAQLRSERYAEVCTSDRRWASPDAWVQPRFSVRRDDTVASVVADVLTPPSLPRRLERDVKGVLKRLR
jgi:peptidoglycan/xylan/chitin deacetylase (PgdA/CDA1 family)